MRLRQVGAADMQNKKFTLVAVLFLSIIAAGDVLSEIYRWTDESGRVHFSDKAPVQYESETIEVQVNTYESVSYDKSIFNTGKKVVMYSTSRCGYCKKAKQYFKKMGISYTEYDIEKNSKARSEFERMGATGVPVILVGKKRMNGFSEKSFKKIYR